MPPPFMGILWILAILLIGAVLLWGWMQMPIPEPFKTAGRVVIIVIFVIWFIWTIFGLFGSMPMGPYPYRR